MADRELYIPGDPVLAPGTGRTVYYQDTNGAVFQEVRNDAHGNKFTTVHSLDPAVRTGYAGQGGLETDPAERFGYTVYGGRTPHPGPRQAPSAAPEWGPTPAGSEGTDIAARTGGAINDYRPQSTGNGNAEAFPIMVGLVVMLALAALPVGVAYLVHRSAGRRGRDLKQTAIMLALFEPAWVLLLWSWLGNLAWWPSLLALLIPAGYAAYLRSRS